MHWASLAVGLGLLATACREPLPPGIEIRVQPYADRVYKLEEPLGFEGWSLGIDLRGDRTEPAVDLLAIETTAAGRRLTRLELDGAAVAKHTDPGSSVHGTLALRHLEQRLPRDLEADTVRLEAYTRGHLVGERVVALERYAQRQSYRPPVRGCWLVASGHDFGVEHRRWFNRAHFAWDLVKVDGTGSPHRRGSALADYYAFGETLYAPADGRVVLGRSDFADNRPGEPGLKNTSNFVLLDHGGGEYAKLSHLRHGSLLVEPGELVRQGQPLAQVGNSGRSDAPHVHVHFQTLEMDADGIIVGEDPLPIQLSGYRVTSNEGVGRPVERGRPRRGEFLCAE